MQFRPVRKWKLFLCVPLFHYNHPWTNRNEKVYKNILYTELIGELRSRATSFFPIVDFQCYWMIKDLIYWTRVTLTLISGHTSSTKHFVFAGEKGVIPKCLILADSSLKKSCFMDLKFNVKKGLICLFNSYNKFLGLFLLI